MIGFRVLFLQPQPCIRALKYAIGLKSYLGNAVSICFGHKGYTLSRLYGSGEEFFDRMVKLDSGGTDEVRSLIEDFDPSIIHSHNAPNTLTISAINTSDEIPVIHDVHEVLSIHNSGFHANDDRELLAKYHREEKEANEESDGRIYVSEGVRDCIQNRYDVDEEKDIVFRNYVSESMMPRYFREKLSKRDGETHIVYIGCVTSVVEGSHYDLRGIVREIASHQMHIHIYPTINLITQSNDTYRRLSEVNEFIHFHNHMDRKSLLQEITQYDYGWAGFNGIKNNEHLDISFPNKIIEYICSGLPVLAFPHKRIKRFIEKNKLGLTFEAIDELEKRLRTEDLSHIKENVLKSRKRFTIEERIPRVVQFYRKIIEGD